MGRTGRGRSLQHAEKPRPVRHPGAGGAGCRKAQPDHGHGAQLFFWARVAYAVIYLAGWPWVRTAAWAVSVIGLLMIFFQLM